MQDTSDGSRVCQSAAADSLPCLKPHAGSSHPCRWLLLFTWDPVAGRDDPSCADGRGFDSSAESTHSGSGTWVAGEQRSGVGSGPIVDDARRLYEHGCTPPSNTFSKRVGASLAGCLAKLRAESDKQVLPVVLWQPFPAAWQGIAAVPYAQPGAYSRSAAHIYGPRAHSRATLASAQVIRQRPWDIVTAMEPQTAWAPWSEGRFRHGAEA